MTFKLNTYCFRKHVSFLITVLLTAFKLRTCCYQKSLSHFQGPPIENLHYIFSAACQMLKITIEPESYKHSCKRISVSEIVSCPIRNSLRTDWIKVFIVESIIGKSGYLKKKWNTELKMNIRGLVISIWYEITNAWPDHHGLSLYGNKSQDGRPCMSAPASQSVMWRRQKIRHLVMIELRLMPDNFEHTLASSWVQVAHTATHTQTHTHT